MMLEHLGEHAAGAAVLKAIETYSPLGRSKLTLDLGGTTTAAELGTASTNAISGSLPLRTGSTPN